MAVMIFNDDNVLDFRGFGFSDGVMDLTFGYDAGEVVITGRVPGALYVSDISDGVTLLEYVLPQDFSPNIIQSVSDLPQVGIDGAGEIDGGAVVVDNSDATPTPANDDAPQSLALVSDGKDTEPLVLIAGGDEGVVVDTAVTDLHDLTIPPIPLSASEAPVVTVTPPTLDLDPAPVMIGGRAYESLSFLIIDTPFAVGDNQLPETLRPSIEALLGLLGSNNDDDGQAFVMPARSWVLG